jgi:hypothetical protein
LQGIGDDAINDVHTVDEIDRSMIPDKQQFVVPINRSFSVD